MQSISYTQAVFLPTNHTLRSIYGKAWNNFGFSFHHLPVFKNKLERHKLSVFAKINHIFKNGYSEGALEKTHIRLTPFTFGLEWIKPLRDGKYELCIGMAPRLYFISTRNQSLYVPRHTTNWRLGTYSSVNLIYHKTERLSFNTLLDYSYVKFSAPKSTATYVGLPINASGFSLGIGIGWEF